MKTLYFTLIILLISTLVSGQTDTGNAGHFENRLLQNITIIKSDPGDAARIIDGPPVHPIQPHSGAPTEDLSHLNRLVFFIHGLGGEITSWERVANAMMYPSQQGVGFYARKCHTFRFGYAPSYSTMVGVAADMSNAIGAQANIYKSYQGYNPDPKNNFIIAHSQGGIVTRTIAHLEKDAGINNYGGYVTVASSLQGARILNNRASLLNFAEDACSKLAAGKLAESIPVTASAKVNTVLFGLSKKIINYSCSGLGTILPELFKEYTYQLTDDYKVGASHISDLNAATNHPELMQLHKIAFYGVEPPENILWRTFNWMIKPTNGELPWEANDDFYLLQSFVIPTRNDYQNYYQTNKDKYIFNYQKYMIYSWLPVLGISYYNKAMGYHTKMIQWGKGVTWFDNANEGWNSIIGALEKTTTTICECYCLHNGVYSYTYTPDCTDCAVSCPGYLLSSGPVTHITWTRKENDGIVLAESAKDLPGATFQPQKLNGIEILGQPPTGSSHFQIRNDEGLRKYLSKLLDEKLDPWFALQIQ
ncbi:MAG TPA: hypothetical protein P5228_12285 [Bacteroidales bacterium]|nr:hypothetical protein [Bacteroidales bacterium]HRZ48439.1 hypothetical protein [Bacteroidales bacterium]